MSPGRTTAHHFVILFFTVFKLFLESGAIAIDNALIGEPEVECKHDGVVVRINTDNPFNGQIYVKGQYTDKTCRNDQDGIRNTEVELKFDSCNIQRLRSLVPRGVQVITTIVVTFHEKFITMSDRAYRIKCFYMEADKTVTTEMDVNMITTQLITATAGMPLCRYAITDRPGGKPIDFVSVGQEVYHSWECKSETSELYCIRVHSCFVDDGNGDRVNLLDEHGCALDAYLLWNLNYVSDTEAGQYARVFKYADRPQVFFQCQVDLSVREPSLDCPRPVCDDPQILKFMHRRKRASMASSLSGDLVPALGAATQDVVAGFEVTDLTEESTPDFPRLRPRKSSHATYCIPAFTFTITIASVSLFLFIVAVTGTTLVMMRKRS